MLKEILKYISGTTSYQGNAIDKIGFWTFLLAVAAFLAWWVAKRQLGGISKAAKADFIKKFTDDFFSETTRDIIMLFDYNALHYQNKDIDYGKDVPSKPFPYFVIDENIVKQLQVSPEQQKILLDRRVYSSFEIDDYLLGYFEDLGAFEKNGLIDIDAVYSGFDWYINIIWNNEEIGKYINSQKDDEDEGEDIYENFQYIYEKSCSYGKAKSSFIKLWWWKLTK